MDAKIIYIFVILCKVILSVAIKVDIPVAQYYPPGAVYYNTTLIGAISAWVANPGTPLTACAFASSDVVDSYFVMKYIPTQQANEITININYELSCCCCTPEKIYKFSIGLYVLLSSTELSTIPNPNTSPYTYVGELRNTSVMQGTTKVPFSSQIIFGMKGFSGLYIAFRDQGICGNVQPLTIHYYKCPSIGGEQMQFIETIAPNTSTAVLTINGNCVAHSQANTVKNDNFMLCYQNGTANVYGGCHCSAGYYNSSSSQCKVCPPKTFKDVPGNFQCKICGANVIEGKLPRTSICKCMDGFYRPTAFVSSYAVNCEAPPSEPRNLNATIIGSTWAFLRWKEPIKNGTLNDVEYEISYNSKTEITRNLYFNITGLDTFADYNVTVSSINKVTIAINMKFGKTISLKTFPGLPSEVQNLILKRNNDASVTVSWKEPSSKGGSDLQYFVVVNGDKGRFTKKLNHTVYQKEEAVKYTISVRSYTSSGFSPEKTISFSIQGKAKAGIPLSFRIGAGTSMFIMIVIAIILVVVFYRRRHPKHLQSVRLENRDVILPNLSAGARVYIDQRTYKDVEEAVKEFANELERSWIELERLIGGGEFGDIFEGTLRKPSSGAKTVSVKTLKSNADKKARDDFLGEAAYMGQFDDPNVISIEGAIVKGRPVMIVIEFMSNGSLDSFLQNNDGKLSSMQLLDMARGVSSGMTYLAEMMFIHRDLGARNVLVNENMVCKVADFGMSRKLQNEEETYSTTDGKIPVRWTAPEAIQFKKFTVASDIWSYGVLLWEIMSFGERPYWDWGNYEVLERLTSGYRLPPPMSCPKVVHDLMLSCWRKDRVKRPKFREIRDTIDKWIRSPDLLKLEGSVVTKRDENLHYASKKALKEWLDSIGLGHYIENFSNKGLVTPRQILELNDADLKEIGVAAYGHRNKIIKSINTTKKQLILPKSLAI